MVIIAVYFGKLPQYFQLWLNSCSYNADFSWLIYTDADLAPYSVPQNVAVRRMTLGDFYDKMSQALDLVVGSASPYKVCDFRPAFWILLENEPRAYEYWGHCDVDMIFGNLRAIITTELLASHDKIFSTGHLTIYRNAPLSNEMFRRPHPAIDWRAVLTDSRHRGFDEHIGVNRIWEAQNGRVFADESLIADIDPAIRRFELTSPNRNYRRQLFYFDRGHVYRGYQDGAEWRVEEFLYIHFQKRVMSVSLSGKLVRYAIAPGGFFDLPDGTSPRALAEQLNPRRFNLGETAHRLRTATRRFRRRYGFGPPDPDLL